MGEAGKPRDQGPPGALGADRGGTRDAAPQAGGRPRPDLPEGAGLPPQIRYIVMRLAERQGRAAVFSM